MCAHCHLFCLHSTAFLVVWGAGTALAASPSEKPAERSSREAPHATPHELYELHETHPLSQVSLGPACSSAVWMACCVTHLSLEVLVTTDGGSDTTSCTAQRQDNRVSVVTVSTKQTDFLLAIAPCIVKWHFPLQICAQIKWACFQASSYALEINLYIMSLIRHLPDVYLNTTGFSWHWKHFTDVLCFNRHWKCVACKAVVLWV